MSAMPAGGRGYIAQTVIEWTFSVFPDLSDLIQSHPEVKKGFSFKMTPSGWPGTTHRIVLGVAVLITVGTLYVRLFAMVYISLSLRGPTART